VEPASLLGPIKLAWDKLVWVRLVDRARGKLVVRVRVHHAYLDRQEPAFFINVQNQSPQRSAMVTHVWLDMTQDVPILSKPLPCKIEPNSEWETFILEDEAPTTDLQRMVELTRVRLSGDHEVRAELRTNVPSAGYIPDG
jgi:hypothetical protein